MNEFLKKLIKKKEQEINVTRAKIKESTDANEVRALGETLEALLSELQDAKDQLDESNDDGSGDGSGEGGGNGSGEGEGGTGDQGRSLRSGLNPMATYVQGGQVVQRNSDPLDTEEYRTAFMNFVCRGTQIPAEVRANATTTTTDAGAVIPTSILNEIIQRLDTYGNIYAKVRKLDVQGGVEIPILSLKPTAKWITADTGTSESDLQKIQANTKISFSYYGLECKISQTLLTNVTTLAMFQNMFTDLATEAMVKAIEKSIMAGTGSGEMTGITVDTRIPESNVITMSDDELGKWTEWKKKVFGKMKKAYRNGEFIVNQSTFDGYIDGMVDTNGQPIGRVNYGIESGETYRFGGKNVETVEGDIIASYDDAEVGDVIGVFANLSDYAINSNLQMQVVKWTDNDTNEIKNKAILIADGKLVDPNGVLIIKKGAVSQG